MPCPLHGTPRHLAIGLAQLATRLGARAAPEGRDHRSTIGALQDAQKERELAAAAVLMDRDDLSTSTSSATSGRNTKSLRGALHFKLALPHRARKTSATRSSRGNSARRLSRESM